MEALTKVTNPPHYSSKRWSRRVQKAEEGSDVWTLHRRSRGFIDKTQTPVLSYHHKLSTHLCLCLLRVCHCFFTGRYLCFLSFSTPHSLTVNRVWDPGCFHILTLRTKEASPKKLWMFSLCLKAVFLSSSGHLVWSPAVPILYEWCVMEMCSVNECVNGWMQPVQ